MEFLQTFFFGCKLDLLRMICPITRYFYYFIACACGIDGGHSQAICASVRRHRGGGWLRIFANGELACAFRQPQHYGLQNGLQVGDERSILLKNDLNGHTM